MGDAQMTNSRNRHQIIRNPDGEPEYEVISYAEYITMLAASNLDISTPDEVLKAYTKEGKSLLRAWREYRGVTRKDMARRMGLSESSIRQMESKSWRPSPTALDTWATALEILAIQLKE
jgi:DNA-binding XRE family transcriptional regulator